MSMSSAAITPFSVVTDLRETFFNFLVDEPVPERAAVQPRADVVNFLGSLYILSTNELVTSDPSAKDLLKRTVEKINVEQVRGKLMSVDERTFSRAMSHLNNACTILACDNPFISSSSGVEASELESGMTDVELD